MWLQSYYKEKDSIESMGTFEKLTLGQYCALWEKGAPTASPIMCVLAIKKDENLLPLRAKSCIVVLGNHEDQVWTKSEKFAPILRPDLLRFFTSLAVNHHRTLKQGDVKNIFCNIDLPPDKVTIVHSSMGNPGARKNEYWLLRKTCYGLQRSPRYWFNKIDDIFKSIGLKPNLYDPCLYSGFIQDPSNNSNTSTMLDIAVGLYVDDFVFFSKTLQ